MHHNYVFNVSGCMGCKRKSREEKDMKEVGYGGVRVPASLFLFFCSRHIFAWIWDSL